MHCDRVHVVCLKMLKLLIFLWCRSQQAYVPRIYGFRINSESLFYSKR